MTDPPADVVDYYYSVLSTWSYVGCERLREIAARRGVSIRHHPVDLRRVFHAGGAVVLEERPPQRQRYRLVELDRWRSARCIPLNLHPRHWPFNPRKADRLVVAVQRRGIDPTPLSNALMRAVWAEERDLSRDDTLRSIADAVGLPGRELLEAAGAAEIEAEYVANTEAAIARDVFGAPTYIYRDEPFFGQDRLEHLDCALAGLPPTRALPPGAA